LREANPQNKIYFVGLKLPDFYFIKGIKHGTSFTSISDFAFCLVSRLPFFDLHFKVLSLVYSWPV